MRSGLYPTSAHCKSTPRERAAASTLFHTGNLSSACLFQKTATRLALGIVSFTSSSHFPPNSRVRPLTPVTFPPGRSKLATNLDEPDRPQYVITIGIVLVAFIAAAYRRRCLGHDDVNLELHQLGRKIVKLRLVAKNAGLKNDVLSFDVTKLAQALPERLNRAR